MNKSGLGLPVVSIVCLALAGCVAPPPAGDMQSGFSVWGYLGTSPTVPAPMRQVVLLDAKSGDPLASSQTNFMGKYTFNGLPPGQYVLDAPPIKRSVAVVDASVRVDIDLSAPDGAMNYAAGAAAASGSGGAAPVGPNDANL